MAIRNIAVTDTLETFRTTFNDLAANDFGDIANLSGSISSTNLVEAMNETISIATSTAGFTIEDSTSTQQIIGGGDILRVFGTTNEIEAVVSATDTLTIGLPNNVTIGNNLTVSNDLSVTPKLIIFFFEDCLLAIYPATIKYLTKQRTITIITKTQAHFISYYKMKCFKMETNC